jgi:hypothetical protein
MRCASLLVAFLLVMSNPGNGDLDVIKQKNGKSCGLEGNPNGSPPQKDLDRHKNRYNEPAETDFDPHVSLPAMLAPGKDVNRFDESKAATIRGFVVKVKAGGPESCNCEAADPDDTDTHIELGLAQGVPKTQQVIVEVTPRLRMLKAKQQDDWKTDALRTKFEGKWVEVTGWLLFDSAHIKQAENTHPGNPSNFRATCWEIHPVTDIKVLGGPPDEANAFQPTSFNALQRLHASHFQSATAKAALKKLHEEHLSKFTQEERKEAEKEAEEAAKAPNDR